MSKTAFLGVISGLRPSLRVQTVRGKPLTVGERQIIPVARSVSLTLGRPGGPVALGYVRNRPLAVLESYRGQTRYITIPDVTRRILFAIMVLGLLITLLARRAQRRGAGARGDEVP